MLIKELYELDFGCDGCSTAIKVTKNAFFQVYDGFRLHHKVVTTVADCHPFDDDFNDDFECPNMIESHWYYKLPDGQLVHFGHTVQALTFRGDYEFKEDLE